LQGTIGELHRAIKMSARVLLLAPLCLVAAQPAPAAYMETAELLSICESGMKNPVPSNWSYAFCAGIALGILFTDGTEQNRICVPDNIDTKAALQVFIDRAKNEPNKKISGAGTFFRALIEKYPCKK